MQIVYIHIFTFLNFWFWEKKKGSRIFFSIRVQKKKFQKILKKHHTKELHKKGTILHQAP